MQGNLLEMLPENEGQKMGQKMLAIHIVGSNIIFLRRVLRQTGTIKGIILYGPDRLRDIMALEYFLFGGVPDTPEPMYGRGDYQFHTDIRHTRSATKNALPKRTDARGEIFGFIEMNVDTGEIIALEVAPKGMK